MGQRIHIETRGVRTLYKHTLLILRLTRSSPILRLAAVSNSGDRIRGMYFVANTSFFYNTPNHPYFSPNSHCDASLCRSKSYQPAHWDCNKINRFTLPQRRVELARNHLRSKILVEDGSLSHCNRSRIVYGNSNLY